MIITENFKGVELRYDSSKCTYIKGGGYVSRPHDREDIIGYDDEFVYTTATWFEEGYTEEALYKYKRVKTQETIHLANAFSLQMLEDLNCKINIKEVKALPSGLTSAIGHQDTANVLGVEMNRVSISLKKGDILYVAQLVGGRLPEGSTTLPDGFTFKFVKVTIL